MSLTLRKKVFITAALTGSGGTQHVVWHAASHTSQMSMEFGSPSVSHTLQIASQSETPAPE